MLLVVVATYHQDKLDQDTLHLVKRLLSIGGDGNHGYYHNNNNTNILDMPNQEEVLLELKIKLPRLLGVSIMVESHLRRTKDLSNDSTFDITS